MLLLGLIPSVVMADNAAPESSVTQAENQAFQQFDNQFYIGLGTTYGNLTNGYGQNSNY